MRLYLIAEMHTHTRTMFYTSSVAVCRSLLIELDAVLAFFSLMYSAKKKKEGFRTKEKVHVI